jgi:hypothetical protein
MKLVKSLLLGSAAGLVAVASAQAADLPTKKAAPAEYVRICDAYGVGFFYIPGTDTCLRISGMVRAEYAWSTTKATNTSQFSQNAAGVVTRGAIVSSRGVDSIGIRARGRVNFDARTQTAFGTLRSFFRLESWSDAGYMNSFFGGPSEVYKTRPTYAFIQFAGITAGRAQSFFDFFGDNWNWGSVRNSDNQVPQLAYTATFGGGFSATVAIEDPSTVGGFYYAGNIPTATSYAVKATAVRYPDAVGALRVDQGWGSAQLSGAFGRREVSTGTALGAVNINKSYNIWAVKGGVQINLPMLAAGDQLWLEASYAKGQIERLGGAYYQGNNENGFRTGFIGNWSNAGIYANGTTYGVNTGKGWAIFGAFTHYWAPSLRSVVLASYLDWSNGNAVKAMGFLKGNEFRVASQLIWSPVKDTDIGVELLYAKARNSLSAPMAAAVRAAGLKKDPDAIEARLRIQRGF